MFGKLFGRKKREVVDVSDWNTVGRAVAEKNVAELTAFHEGRSEEPKFAEDSRTPEMAEAVLAQVIALNQEGRGRQAREMFDPAHAPFIPELEKGVMGLSCCAILGQDNFLVQQGAPYQEGKTWLIDGDTIRQVTDIARFAWSRNRAFFVTVHQDGSLSVGQGFDDPQAERIPALPGSAFVPRGLPDDLALLFEEPGDGHACSTVAVSDDGKKILLCDDARGIALLIKGNFGWQTRLLYPSVKLDLEDQMREILAEEDEGESFSPFFDMMHAALSPDGRFVALGTQDAGHYLLELDEKGQWSPYAELGYLSEYPHDACFSDDSATVAFNSCHFYSGVTFACDLAEVQGLTTPPYEQHATQRMLNTYLRVYASGFLPPSMTGQQGGAFLLAGSGFAACVTPQGKLLWEVGFGSSGGAVDVCPETGRVLIASYSGMLHLFDPSQAQSPAIMTGYNAPQEVGRWIFWERLGHPIFW